LSSPRWLAPKWAASSGSLSLFPHELFKAIRLPAVHHLDKNTVLPLRTLPKNLHLFEKESGHRMPSSMF